MDAYQEDLAYIHESGYAELAYHAAATVLEEVPVADNHCKLIVDLGCGGGTLARRLCQAGYNVVGYDISEAMINMARNRVPEASFFVGSFVDVEFPPCIAVTATGEVFNYLFDDRNDASALEAVTERIYTALCPGGVLVFDAAGPDRAQGEATKPFANYPDWSILVSTSQTDNILTRRITSFRRVKGLYRRCEEEHRLRLIAPTHVSRMLTTIGFEVRQCSRYADRALPDGLHSFVARKPAKSST